MTIETVVLLGFGRGVGLEAGTARYLPAFGFGVAEPAKATVVSKSQNLAVVRMINRNSSVRRKPYGRRTHHTTGTAFDEVRE